MVDNGKNSAMAFLLRTGSVLLRHYDTTTRRPHKNCVCLCLLVEMDRLTADTLLDRINCRAS